MKKRIGTYLFYIVGLSMPVYHGWYRFNMPELTEAEAMLNLLHLWGIWLIVLIGGTAIAVIKGDGD